MSPTPPIQHPLGSNRPSPSVHSISRAISLTATCYLLILSLPCIISYSPLPPFTSSSSHQQHTHELAHLVPRHAQQQQHHDSSAHAAYFTMPSIVTRSSGLVDAKPIPPPQPLTEKDAIAQGVIEGSSSSSSSSSSSLFSFSFPTLKDFSPANSMVKFSKRILSKREVDHSVSAGNTFQKTGKESKKQQQQQQQKGAKPTHFYSAYEAIVHSDSQLPVFWDQHHGQQQQGLKNQKKRIKTSKKANMAAKEKETKMEAKEASAPLVIKSKMAIPFDKAVTIKESGQKADKKLKGKKEKKAQEDAKAALMSSKPIEPRSLAKDSIASLKSTLSDVFGSLDPLIAVDVKDNKDVIKSAAAASSSSTVDEAVCSKSVPDTVATSTPEAPDAAAAAFLSALSSSDSTSEEVSAAAAAVLFKNIVHNLLEHKNPADGHSASAVSNGHATSENDSITLSSSQSSKNALVIVDDNGNVEAIEADGSSLQEDLAEMERAIGDDQGRDGEEGEEGGSDDEWELTDQEVQDAWEAQHKDHDHEQDEKDYSLAGSHQQKYGAPQHHQDHLAPVFASHPPPREKSFLASFWPFSTLPSSSSSSSQPYTYTYPSKPSYKWTGTPSQITLLSCALIFTSFVLLLFLISLKMYSKRRYASPFAFFRYLTTGLVISPFTASPATPSKPSSSSSSSSSTYSILPITNEKVSSKNAPNPLGSLSTTRRMSINQGGPLSAAIGRRSSIRNLDGDAASML